ncbi:TPA: hypothetical protein QDZ58_000460 [Pluralibacter gergoviae]|nr:hypothetical protein [Pluralibacter gergoviae]
MRDYGKVHTSFWISDGMRRVSDDARLLALYLLTGQHTNMIGCFRLPDGYVSEDLSWSQERVSKGFAELSDNGFATRDPSSKWVLIRNFMTWNPIENPNQGIAALRLFDQVPDKSTIKPELAGIMAMSISHIDVKKLKGSERVIEPFLNQEQEQEQEQERDQTHLGHGDATPHDDESRGEYPAEKPKPGYTEEFEQAWQEYPKRSGGNSKADAFKAWTARIKTGATAEELTDGVRRYARYAAASGKLGTEYVKQASTFFGPSKHYEEPWAYSAPSGQRDPNIVPQPDSAIPTGFRG